MSIQFAMSYLTWERLRRSGGADPWVAGMLGMGESVGKWVSWQCVDVGHVF